RPTRPSRAPRPRSRCWRGRAAPATWASAASDTRTRAPPRPRCWCARWQTPSTSAMAATWDVLVVGGGATGAGLVRDLAMRGLRCLLVEQGDLATGTTGHFHGLLHSGGRYAVTDPAAARECIAENRIVRRIAAPEVEETGGLFCWLEDDPDD